MAEARNHHFVPQGYLRQFADGHGRKARVFTIDRQSGKAFTTKVRNVAAVRDFNRIDAEGHHPNALEEAYAKFEAPAAEALRRIVQERSFSDEGDRLLVLNLLALLAARNPRNRATWDKFMSDIARGMMEAVTSTEERWREMERQLAEAGEEVGEGSKASTYEEMRDFVRSDGYEVIADQTHQIGLELQMVDTILPTLVPRRWTLHVAAQDAGDFVTTDHPVCLVPVDWEPSPLLGVGFGMPGTAVIFPMSRKLLLTGMFEGEETVRQQDSFGVARLNSQVIDFADRQVYAFDASFQYVRSDLEVATGSDLAHDQLFRRQRRT